MNFNHNLSEVRYRIEKAALKSGRQGHDITLVAVSKTVDEAAVRQAWELGVKDFGENRVQELVKKSNALPKARWHFIGRLQTNKVKEVVNRAYLIHSLDRWQLAYELDKRAGQEDKRVEALIQVNITGENSKTGFAIAEVEEFLAAGSEFNYLRIKGLMTMAIEDENPENSRLVFRELANLRQRMNQKFPQVNLEHLSMGMSQDYEVAIEEGADIVRIGSALFK